MNLLARILSHGFAIAIALLLAVGLIYRGELFPDWELPEFLSLGTPTENGGFHAEDNVTPEAPGSGPATDTVIPPVMTGKDTPAVTDEVEPATMPETSVDTAVEQGTEAAVEPVLVTATTAPEADASASAVITETAEPAATIVSTADTAVPPTPEPAAVPQAVDVDEPPETADVSTRAAGPDGAIEQTAPEPAVMPEDTAPVTAILPATVETAATEEAEIIIPEMTHSATTTVDTAVVDTVTPRTAADATTADIAVTTVAPLQPVAAATSEPPAQQAVEPATPPAAAAPQPELIAPAEFRTTAPASTALPETGTYQILAKAREAYWLRDYETAENNYRQLATMEPDNPDSYGELGNMYFSQGKWEQAAVAYFEAGTRLVKEGQLEQAQQLVDVIRGLNGTQADELNKLITAAQAAIH